jgi:hypothetical protein
MKNHVLAIVGQRWSGYYLKRQVAKMGNCLLFDITDNIGKAKKFSCIEAKLVSGEMINIGGGWVEVVPVILSCESLL